VLKKKIVVPVLLVLIAVAAGVYYWRLHAVGRNGATDELVLFGNVDIREVHVAFNGSEHVSEMLVDEGDRVKAGQLLARLQTDRLQAALARARANVAAARADARSARLNYNRIESLAKRKLVSKADADVAEANNNAAAARVKSFEASVTEAAQALKDANLYAPVDGVIRERLVQTGDFVTPQSPVYTLAMTDPVWVRAYLPEPDLGRVKPGSHAEITTDSYPNKVYAGWVGAISPTAEFTPKNVETPDLRTRLVYQVRVLVCNPQEELRLGMPATVRISLSQQQPAQSSASRCAPAGSGANN